MLDAVNEALAIALRSSDPARALEAAIERLADKLTDEERALLRHVDADGLALSRLLVKKLRFERALAGDRSLREELERSPETLMADFARYDASSPPVAHDGPSEAEQFQAFRVALREPL